MANTEFIPCVVSVDLTSHAKTLLALRHLILIKALFHSGETQSSAIVNEDYWTGSVIINGTQSYIAILD